MKTIAIVTGTRAEYGILKPLLKKIDGNKRIKLELIVTGMHLLKDFGSTEREIEKDGFKIKYRVPIYGKKIRKNYHAKALARGISSFSEVLAEINPSFLIILGDRLEIFSAAIAAAFLNIPIVHIHGGDKTDSGHIDESIRHSISQFANIHFTATDKHTRRLIQMGQESWRIFQVGYLGLDSIVQQKFISKKDLFQDLGLKNEKTIVCLFHPVHLEIKTTGNQMNEILKSLVELKIQSVIIYPNNDKGSKQIISKIQKIKSKPNFKIFKNIPHEKYVSLLKHSDLLIGNSSSGMMESSSVGIPVINIGTRNTGREHAQNVIFVNPKRNEITKAINFAINNEKFNKMVTRCKNPYGNGNTSKKILSVLSSLKLDDRLLRKRITI